MVKGGWRSRNYLPHFDVPGLVQVLTFRLEDALPVSVVARLCAEAQTHEEAKRDAEVRRLKERWLDSGHGACWLGRPEIARSLERTMLATDGEECLLLAWTVMPNHVHAIVELADDVPLGKLLRLWKGPTAREANLFLGRQGRFWFPEYHDRYIRDASHLANAVRYIDENPVKAGLCERVSDWEFGSARLSAG